MNKNDYVVDERFRIIRLLDIQIGDIVEYHIHGGYGHERGRGQFTVKTICVDGRLRGFEDAELRSPRNVLKNLTKNTQRHYNEVVRSAENSAVSMRDILEDVMGITYEQLNLINQYRLIDLDYIARQEQSRKELIKNDSDGKIREKMLFKNNIHRKLHGEVFTPPSLIEECIDKFDPSVWVNPNAKFLDAAAGSGNILKAFYNRLMVSLKEWEPDDEKRSRHILKNMLYGVEYRSSNCMIACDHLDPYHTVDMLNIRKADSLEFNFWNLKFDVIGCNPPYQAPVEGDYSYWARFVQKALTLLTASGSMFFIHPKGWLSPTADIRKGFVKIKDLFVKQGFLKYVDVSKNVNESFKGVGQDICWYVFENGKKSEKTTFKTDTGEILVDIAQYNYFPVKIDKLALSIFGKVFSKTDLPRFKFTYQKVYWDKNVSEEETDFFQYHRINGNSNKITQPIWTAEKCIHHDRKKIFVPYNGTKYIFVVDIGSVGISNGFYMLLDDSVNTANLDMYLNSKLVQFMVSHKRTQYNEGAVANSLPFLDFSQEWSNETIYAFFGLTTEEVEYIEKHT